MSPRHNGWRKSSSWNSSWAGETEITDADLVYIDLEDFVILDHLCGVGLPVGSLNQFIDHSATWPH